MSAGASVAPSAAPPEAITTQTAPQNAITNEAPVPPPKKWKQRVQTFVVENYLPIAFAVAMTFALAYPVPGRYLVSITVLGNVHIVQEVNMALVFLCSGLALNTTELRKAMRRESLPSVIFGFVMIIVLTPVLGFAMREIPLTPPAFSVGLTIFCLVPTTLGIGIALVRSCKGNEAISLLLTVGTNMLGVLTMPLWIKFLFINHDTQGLKLNINIPDLLAKLSVTILVPSIIGKALRDLFKPVEELCKKYRVFLSLFSTSNLAFIVWQTLSGARDLLFEQRASMIVSVIVLAAAIHVFLLILNHLLVRHIFHPPVREAVAVVIMAAQKSAPVAVTVISYITSDPAQQGLLAIPSIVGQLSQIFIGAGLGKYLAPRVDRIAKEEAAAAAARQAQLEAELAAAANADASHSDKTEAALAQQASPGEGGDAAGRAGEPLGDAVRIAVQGVGPEPPAPTHGSIAGGRAGECAAPFAAAVAADGLQGGGSAATAGSGATNGGHAQGDGGPQGKA